jgi:hypothetical protein
MPDMIRKQVYIEARQEHLLKTLAKDLHVTEAELIRRGIDRGLDRMDTRPDPAAWDEAERFIRARMRRRTIKGKRRWTREDLHDR